MSLLSKALIPLGLVWVMAVYDHNDDAQKKVVIDQKKVVIDLDSNEWQSTCDIIHPENKKSYPMSIKFSDRSIALRGCVFGIFCKKLAFPMAENYDRRAIVERLERNCATGEPLVFKNQ